MKRFVILFSVSVILCVSLSAQYIKINLYPDGDIPNYADVGETELWDSTSTLKVSKVQMPDMLVFLPSPKIRSDKAVVVCPGGGYRYLAYDREGEDIAKYWNSKGITAIVLKSRLPDSKAQIEPHKSPLMDAQRAIRMVRYHAEEWGINPDKVGVMGFSAGGHLASSVSTHFDAGNPDSSDPVERMSCRPDFSVLIYPVITMTGDFQHKGSRLRLVGEDEMLMEYFSSELQVNESTPPAILIHASDDHAVPVENSIVYYQALVKNGVDASMHIYPHGGHGFSLAVGQGILEGWMDRCVEWVKTL